MQETVPTEQGEVVVATITTLAAKTAQLRGKKGDEFNDAFTLEALRAGGCDDPQPLVDRLGFLTDYPAVHLAAMRVNGLKAPTKGEGQPAGPAASISTGSTDPLPDSSGTA